MYEGLEDHFLLENAIPYENYEFEIYAFTYDENKFLASSKTVSLLTPSESKLACILFCTCIKLTLIETIIFKEPAFRHFPTILVDSENQTNIMKINWRNAFDLNGPLKKYELFINNRSAYEGNKTDYEIEVNETICALSEIKYDVIYMSIHVKVIIDFYENMSPVLEIPINCTNCK